MVGFYGHFNVSNSSIANERENVDVQCTPFTSKRIAYRMKFFLPSYLNWRWAINGQSYDTLLRVKIVSVENDQIVQLTGPLILYSSF